nr:MAG TPA: hypothetical protein [Caudoviricetes sp.]
MDLYRFCYPKKSFLIPIVRTTQRNRTLFHSVKQTIGIFL